MAQFDGLELDAADPGSTAAFWETALGGRSAVDAAGRPVVRPGTGRPAREILRVRPAVDPAPDDARVHVDLCLPGDRPDHLLAAGAGLVRPPGTDPWYVLADPEGNRFCAFPAVDDRPPGMFQLVVKCSDPHLLAQWWAGLLGGRAIPEGEAAAVVGAPEFPWNYMAFDPVPGIERHRSRVRWHLRARDSDLTALLDHGARVRAEPDGDGHSWILADPGGNEFCLTVGDQPRPA